MTMEKANVFCAVPNWFISILASQWSKASRPEVIPYSIVVSKTLDAGYQVRSCHIHLNRAPKIRHVWILKSATSVVIALPNPRYLFFCIQDTMQRKFCLSRYIHLLVTVPTHPSAVFRKAHLKAIMSRGWLPNQMLPTASTFIRDNVYFCSLVILAPRQVSRPGA